MHNASLNCGHCGAELPQGARFCKHCGSSDADGWSDNAYEADLDDEFDYDEFVENEFPSGQMATRLHPVWKAIAVTLLILFALALLQL